MSTQGLAEKVQHFFQFSFFDNHSQTLHLLDPCSFVSCFVSAEPQVLWDENAPWPPVTAAHEPDAWAIDGEVYLAIPLFFEIGFLSFPRLPPPSNAENKFKSRQY
jgi:hypothetical protein